MKKLCKIEIDPVNGNSTVEVSGTLPELLAYATECVHCIYDGLKDEKAKKTFKKAFVAAVNDDLPFCDEESVHEKAEKKQKQIFETISENIDTEGLKEALEKSGFGDFLKKILFDGDEK